MFIIGLILALLATLSLSDPMGRYLVGDKEIKEGTFPQHLAYVLKDDPTIYLNITWVLNTIKKTRGEHSRIVDAYAVGACVLVHEAVHLKPMPNPDHELPDLYQYVCLDRLGASAAHKQELYDAINKTVREKYR